MRRGPTPGQGKQGTCPVCLRRLSVNPSGVMRVHPERQPVKCTGSGLLPLRPTSPTHPDSLERRVEVVEQKLDAALRAVALMGASTQPAIEWMDATLAKIEDPRQIGVPRK